MKSDRRFNRCWSLAFVTILVMLLGVSPSSGQNGHTKLPDPIPGLIPLGNIKVKLQPVADDLISPVATAIAPGDEGHMYVVDQTGQIWRVKTDDGERHGGQAATRQSKTLFADLGWRLVKVGLFPPVNYDDRG